MSWRIWLGVVAFVIIVALCYQPRYTEYTIRVRGSSIPRRLMVVAHPDDEVLWGHRYLSDSPGSWKVICLTCATDEGRVAEFSKAMQLLGISHYELWDHENSVLGWRIHPNAVARLQREAKLGKYTAIVTHSAIGEYGNLQHMALHRAMRSINAPVTFFSPRQQQEQQQAKAEIASRCYPSQRWIIAALQPFHSRY